jgi:hypothetical protein
VIFARREFQDLLVERAAFIPEPLFSHRRIRIARLGSGPRRP